LPIDSTDVLLKATLIEGMRVRIRELFILIKVTFPFTNQIRKYFDLS